ncbi:MAG TPA: peptidoglycan DD-metalloendopeptidase family protein [Longimicrobiales bacterium]|nr:peptidoglycan DD-metalloendopeptidase family protein [Longimicrobiales bacterium]
MKRPTLALLSISFSLLTACAHGEQLAPRPAAARTLAVPPRPFDPNARVVTDVARTRWERAARSALHAAVPVPTNFREVLSLPGDEPHVLAYELALAAGQRITVAAERGASAAPLALDVFQRVAPDSFRHAATLPAGASAEFGAESAGRYVLRLQPEPGGGEYTVSVRGEMALRFPIPGHDVDAIRSGYGSARDGGTRSHEGVDIFAPRGTPVVAVAAAVVTAVETTRSGGRVVWAEDPALGLTYYYAHLDEQLVKRGRRLVAGDTIGRVGNTGNARRASPHLHFAIYRPGLQPLDPTPLLAGAASDDTDSVAEPAATAMLGGWAQTRGSRVRLRARPSTGGPILAELAEGTPVRVLGALRDWHRVRLVDGTSGFIAEHLLERASLATH